MCKFLIDNTWDCVNTKNFYNMKKGEGGGVSAGKRSGSLENGGGALPYTTASFHRSGDQSLTKNLYFSRQLNGYHMVSTN